MQVEGVLVLEDILSKKSPEVTELVDEINKIRKVDNERHLDLACDLFDMAQERGNDDLKDFASCILGDACCQNGDYSQALYYLSAGLQGLAQTDEYLLACLCYNELGIIFRSECHYITSEEHFINCIELARAQRLYGAEANACTNFASLCKEMASPERALEYNYRAIECCAYMEDGLQKSSVMAGNYACIFNIYCEMGKQANAEDAYKELGKVMAECPACEKYFDIILAKYHYYRMIGDEKRAEETLNDTLAAFFCCDDYYTYFDEIKDLLQILLEEKQYETLEKMFIRIAETSIRGDVSNLNLFVCNCKIQMYEELGDEQKKLQCAYDYFKYSQQQSIDNKRAFLTTLRLRSELVQQRTRNLFLSAAAETDPLTGIANRLKLNSVIDELFDMANKEGKNLGVEMMDVDSFKHINDSYGHDMGDKLLAAIGRVLKKIVSDNIFVARYGGDEFIIYYYDMSDEEIVEKAKFIQNEIDAVSKKLELERVTLSQGVVNHIPQHGNRAWDYMNSADYALYFVKKHGKANVRLIHKRVDLEKEEWKKVF